MAVSSWYWQNLLVSCDFKVHPSKVLRQPQRHAQAKQNSPEYSYDAVGGIGSSFDLNVECLIDTNGQNPLLPASEAIPLLALPLAVELCPIGTEEKGIFCQPCDLNFYNYNSSACQPCPEGLLPESSAHRLLCKQPSKRNQDRELFLMLLMS